MTAKNESPSIANVKDPELLADLFHALTQPLTTLRCGLGLCLKSSEQERTRRSLEVALQAAESVSGLVAGIRELVEDASSAQGATSSFEECLRDVVEDFGPVANSFGIDFAPASDLSLEVTVESGRLRQGLFHLFEFAVGSCQPGPLRIKTATDGEGAVLMVVGRARQASDGDVELQSRLVLGIARHIFENAGGSVEVQLGSKFVLIVHLPLAGKKPVSKERPASRCCA